MKLKLHFVNRNKYFWFENHLSNQKQCLGIDKNENNSFQAIIWRVTQGSVFDLPLLTLPITNLRNIFND